MDETGKITTADAHAAGAVRLAAGVVQTEPPLCVDLDGTLIAGDSSWELMLALAKSRPWICFESPSGF